MNEDDKAVIEAGYQPQLKRKVGFFASFAISFSFMSIVMGVFANYGYVLHTAGTFGLWSWLIVGIGQLFVALVFAEMAGRLPLTGSLYNWNNRLSHPSIAVTVHWLTVFAYCIGGAGIVVALMSPLQSLLGITLSMDAIRVIGISIFIVQLLIGVYGIGLASHLNKLAVIGEIIAVAVFGLLLLIIVMLKGQAHTELLTTVPTTPTPYWPAFLMSTLLGAWTIFGFETPSDLSEETINAKRITPKSIISSVVVTVLLGLFFISVITIAIPDLTTISAATDPVSSIVSYHLGTVADKIFLVLVVVAMFASSLLCITLGGRLLFAVSRDKHFIAHKKFSTVSLRGIPFYACFLVAIIEAIIFLTMFNLAAIYAAAVVVLFLSYLITVLNFAFSAHKLPTTENFALKKWHWPIVIVATLWLVGEILILTIPKDFHLAALVAGIIFVFAIVQYPLQKFFSGKRF